MPAALLVKCQTTWRQRLRSAFATRRGRVVVPCCAIVAVVAFAMIAGALGLDDRTRLELEIAGFVLPFAAYLSSVLLQLSPSMRWAKRTKEVLISERAIVSVSLTGEQRDLGWRWVRSAGEDDRFIRIAIDEGPGAQIVLAKAMLGSKAELLLEWLAANRKL